MGGGSKKRSGKGSGENDQVGDAPATANVFPSTGKNTDSPAAAADASSEGNNTDEFTMGECPKEQGSKRPRLVGGSPPGASDDMILTSPEKVGVEINTLDKIEQEKRERWASALCHWCGRV